MRPFYTLYNKILEWSSSRFAVIWLATISFLESSILPLPIQDFLLASMSLKNRPKAFYFATICTIASVLGGIVGYYIGAELIEQIGPILVDLGYESKMEGIKIKFLKYGIWFTLVAGFSPFPYKIFTISAGAFDISFPLFLIASTMSRSARFFLVAGLIWKFGKPINTFIDKYFNLLTIIFTILLIGGFFIIRVIL